MKSLRLQANSGQIGLIVLLSMVVIAALGISLATRSSQDVSSSRQTTESTQTFSAAESALEKILSQPSSEVFNFSGSSANQQFTDLQPNTTVNVNIAKSASFQSFIHQGDVVQVDVTNVANGKPLVIQWSKSRDCGSTPASLVVSVQNVSGGNYTTRNYAFGACDNSDNFEKLDGTVGANQGTILSLKKSITLQTGDQLVRIRPVYADTDLAVGTDGSWVLTAQQFTITSVGQNEAVGGNETRAIQLNRSQPQAPSVLDYALVSGTTISK